MTIYEFVVVEELDEKEREELLDFASLQWAVHEKLTTDSLQNGIIGSFHEDGKFLNKSYKFIPKPGLSRCSRA